jgi:glycolate oxidase
LLIVELDGEADAVEADFARLDPLIRATGPTSVRVAADDVERAAIWKGRKSAFSAVGRLSPDFLVQDGVVPRAQLGQALARIERLSADAGLRVANVFHAGDGNLHPLILFDGTRTGELERAEALAGRILRLCIELGGSITGEHGVGLEKRAYLPEMFSPESMAAMWRIRQSIDPELLSNPGKMFPGGEAPALTRHGLHPLERAGGMSRV